MFAFALWDRNRRRCSSPATGWARSRCITPRTGRARSPSPRSWRRWRRCPACRGASIRRRSTTSSRYGYVPDPATIFAGIRKLPAAHYLLLDRSAGRPIPAPRRYWRPPTGEPPIGEAEAVRSAGRQLARCRLASAPDVGRAARRLPLRRRRFQRRGGAAAAGPAGDRPLDTFTIGFAGAEDETPLAARMVARATRTAQHDGARRDGRLHRRGAATRPRSSASRSATAPRCRPRRSAGWPGATRRWRCRAMAATRCSPATAAIAGTAGRGGARACAGAAAAAAAGAARARSIRSSTARRAGCAPSTR